MTGITGSPALDSYQRFAVKPVSSAQKAPETGVNAPRPPEAKAAKVSISPEAKALAEASPQVDRQKVESLKAAIADGSLEVDPTEVAQRMLLDGVDA